MPFMNRPDRHIFSKPALFFALFLLVACFGVFGTSPAQANPKYASLVMDADTGTILHSRHADKKLHPASLTKVMTLMLLFDAMDSGRINLNTKLPVSTHAASMVPSKLGIPAGGYILVKDAIYALVTKSANDIAVAVAEGVGGSESRFASLMTSKARQIGMRHTTFKNASGLHDRRQVTTARDMALMAQHLIRQYGHHYHYFSTRSFKYKGQSFRNHNRLMSSYQGMDGLKTGYINASGFNLVASAVRNNRRLIGVVFGGRTSQSRNDHMAMLLDRGFEKIGSLRVAALKAPTPKEKPILTAHIAALASKTGNSQPSSSESGQTLRWALLSPSSGQAYAEAAGQGDMDPGFVQKMETGLSAVSAHSARSNAGFRGASLDTRTKISSAASGGWSVQIGAFTSRAQTDRALQGAVSKAPELLGRAQPLIVPTRSRSSNDWLFRGRFTGLSASQAQQACKALRDCIAIAPRG